MRQNAPFQVSREHPRRLNSRIQNGLIVQSDLQVCSLFLCLSLFFFPMDVFHCLSHIKETTTQEDFAVVLRVLSAPRYMVSLGQVAQQLKPILSQPGCAALQPEVDALLAQAGRDSVYDSKVTRVADTFSLLRLVWQQLPRAEFAAFVDCFVFDDPEVAHDVIVQRLETFKQRLAPPFREKLQAILDQQAHGQLDDDNGLEMLDMDDDLLDDDMDDLDNHGTRPQPGLRIHEQINNPYAPSASLDATRASASGTSALAPEMRALIDQACQLMHNETALCQPFTQIIESDQLNGLPFSDTLIHIYQWVQTTRPSLWDPLSPILEQMHSLQDTSSDQFTSYEEFVQRTFLDGEGQAYLDGEIAQAQMNDMLNHMSM
ncbi:hypothetical protein BC940DRAFT_36421 [Gongronella butleri]|nr:hypothetical protein BC940DRAFT_36421 [Gongronella butleri]